MKNWKAINDIDVRMIWRCNDEDCECEKYDCIIEPNWYKDNGTPVCMDGRDMDYLRTEVADCNPMESEDVAMVELAEAMEICPYCSQRCFDGEGCDEWQAAGFND
jgi:hypothetical protein